MVHTKTNCDGYKDLGITYPSFELQRELIEDTYHEVGINPHDVEFCEAHCTGTQAGDPSEMRAIYEALCKGKFAVAKTQNSNNNFSFTQDGLLRC